MDRLSPALIHSIFAGENFDVDDEDSLRACALASRRFLLPAQRLLFKTMSFSMEQKFGGYLNNTWELLQNASDTLSSSPHLIAFVRELNVGSMYSED
jgi:hypothetical protein